MCYVLWVLLFQGVQGHMCVDFKCMMHVLRPKCYVFVDFGFLSRDVGGQMYVDVQISMHIMKPKSFILWFFLKV